MPPFERAMAWVTRGRFTAVGLLLPAVVLHTIGAHSGQPRHTELMCVPDGETWLVTGSNYARHDHPGWTWNLLAHPQASIDYRGERIAVLATLVPDEERAAVWQTLEHQWPGYRQYEVASGRQLRVFRLMRAQRREHAVDVDVSGGS
jgi:deazaflavin-dependent oxidoreductase (nitroreductase family)